MTTYEEFKAAVVASKQTFPAWKNTEVSTRQRIMFKLQDLIQRDIVCMQMIFSFLISHADESLAYIEGI